MSDRELMRAMDAEQHVLKLEGDNEMLRDELEQQYARVEALEAVIADMPCTCEGIWHMCDSCKVLEGRHE